MRPNYLGGSLVNLVASIVAARGGNALHPALKNLQHEELRDARNLVLLLIDPTDMPNTGDPATATVAVEI